ncbi:hypothetical protein FKM82_030359 [Ascaphus truei]
MKTVSSLLHLFLTSETFVTFVFLPVDLPHSIHQSTTLPIFKSCLKSHLLREALVCVPAETLHPPNAHSHPLKYGLFCTYSYCIL